MGDTEGYFATNESRRNYEEAAQITWEASEGARDATLYWATAGQTRLAASAARSLPEWSARQALPCPNGLILFEESVGTARLDAGSADSARVDVDGMLWRTREDDFLVVYLLSRSSEARLQIAGHRAMKSPVSPVLWLLCELSFVEKPREREAEEGAFLDLIGALWLLIGQDRVTTTQEVETAKRRPRPAEEVVATISTSDEFERVVVIDLHQAQKAPVESGDRAQAHYRHRWWVEGHWRQQACGPNRSERRPTWIAPHVKGPEDRPFMTDPERVYRLR